MKKIVLLYALILFFCAVGTAAANVTGIVDYPTVPEPSTLLMIGSGIVGMLAFCRRKK